MPANREHKRRQEHDGFLGAVVSTAWPWLAAVGLGAGAGLLGWSLRAYVPRKFEEPRASIVSVALLVVCFPALFGSLWAVMVVQQFHGGLVLGVGTGGAIVLLADRYTGPSSPLER